MMIKFRKYIKSFLQRIAKLIIKTVSFADRKGTHYIGLIIKAHRDCFNNYVLYRYVPKSINSGLCAEPHLKDISVDTAIVIQGVVETKDNFTLESIRFYKQTFPNVQIIVSTWDFTDTKVVSQLESEGCVVILNESFTPSGLGNVNYQICTSLAGIRKAKELGITYCAKTRTDQRLQRNTSFNLLKGLINLFPVEGGLGLKRRIVALSGPLFLPLYFTDFFYFGMTEDLENLFDIPYEPRNIPKSQKYYGETYGSVFTADVFYKDLPPEVYIISNFINKHINTDFSVYFYWDIIKKYFITIDYEDIGLFWPKYSFALSPWFTDSNTLGSFFAIYNNDLEYKAEYEHIREQTKLDVTSFMS